MLALGATGLGHEANAREPGQIRACRTIDRPGSYELVDNLTFKGPTNGACLPITADFVTIDLAGFTISGPVDGGPFGGSAVAIASGDNSTGITVRNGSITGFSVGVDLPGDGSIVEGLRVFGGNGGGIFAKGIVKGNTVGEFIGGPGSGKGISATGIVTGNYVSRNRAFGIAAGQGSTVSGNTVTGSSGGFGISVDCPANVIDNTAVGNEGGNLRLNGEGCNATNNVAP